MAQTNSIHLPQPVSRPICVCDREPFGDLREGTCLRCGRQVTNPLPPTRFSLSKENR